MQTLPQSPTERRSLDSCARCGTVAPCRPATPRDEDGKPLVELWCEDCLRMLQIRVVIDDDGEMD